MNLPTTSTPMTRTQRQELVKELRAQGFEKTGTYLERGQCWTNYDKGRARYQINRVETARGKLAGYAVDLIHME